MSGKKKTLLKMIISALMIAVAMLLPFITAQAPMIGNALCPMHLPVLLCGFFCGPWYGLLVGIISPILRSLLFSAPVLLPKAAAMAFELAAYGFATGFLYKLLPKKKHYIYISLLVSMLFGRIVWGVAMKLLTFVGIKGFDSFGFSLFFAEAFVNAVPAMILQIILVPIVVMTINKVFPETKDLY